MRLSNFIATHLDSILEDWVAFARKQLPAVSGLNEAALLDHAKLLLREVAADMLRPESEGERQAKSEGGRDQHFESSSSPSQEHARQRERQGFDIQQMLAEYRALRASVLRLWSASCRTEDAQDLADVVRFNEAIDQAMAGSTAAFVEEVNRTRNLFLGVLGHDLRGPLNAIAACATLQQRTQSSTAAQSAIVLRSVAQMKALLDDLVEYTRGHLGDHLIIEPAPLRLDQFARDTLQEIAVVGRGRNLTLTTQGNMQVEWDARRMHQVLSNLVFNALKYSFEGTDIHIHLAGGSSDVVVLTVENQGEAIGLDLLPRLFDPLVRAEGARWNSEPQMAGANLGLGLYVVRAIASAHGGSVSVTSQDTTTRFELSLPRIAVAPMRASASAP